MRYLLIKKESMEQYFTLRGVKHNSIFEYQINKQNILVIDKSFDYDITPRFPDFIFGVYKIMANFSKSKMEKVFNHMTNYIYTRPIDSDIIKDLVIILRKYDFQKINIPYIDQSGRIRLILSQYNKNILDNINLTKDYKSYDKLRIIIFNKTIVPYVKTLLF